MTGPEILIDAYVRDFEAHVQLGDHEWTHYQRLDNEDIDAILEAATEAAHRVDSAIRVDVVPDDYGGSPVVRLPGTTVMRTANSAPPWQ